MDYTVWYSYYYYTHYIYIYTYYYERLGGNELVGGEAQKMKMDAFARISVGECKKFSDMKL